MAEISHFELLASGVSEGELRLAIGSIGKNAECLKRDGETSVWKVRLEGRAVVVKQWRLSRPKRRLQALFRRTPAVGLRNDAEWLEKIHIPTAACLGIATGRDEVGPCQWLVMDFVGGKTVLQHLGDDDLTPRQQHRLAEALGLLIGEYELNATRNRDTKPSNLIVRDLPPDAASTHEGPRAVDWLVVIDTDLEFWGGKRKHALLSSLAECVGTGCLPRRTVLMRVLWAMEEHRSQILAEDGFRHDAARHTTFRRTAWRTLERELTRHGDPTPKINPLDSPRP